MRKGLVAFAAMLCCFGLVSPVLAVTIDAPASATPHAPVMLSDTEAYPDYDLIFSTGMGRDHDPTVIRLTATESLFVHALRIEIGGLLSDIDDLNRITAGLSNGVGGVMALDVATVFIFSLGTAIVSNFTMAAGDTLSLTLASRDHLASGSSGLNSNALQLEVAVLASAVPLPGGLPLSLTALGGLAALHLRRKAP